MGVLPGIPAPLRSDSARRRTDLLVARGADRSTAAQAAQVRAPSRRRRWVPPTRRRAIPPAVCQRTSNPLRTPTNVPARLPRHRHLVRRSLPGADPGAAARLAGDRARRAHAAARADRQRQDAGRVPGGHRPRRAPAGRRAARSARALRVAAQGAGLRRRAHPARAAGGHPAHRRTLEPAVAADRRRRAHRRHAAARAAAAEARRRRSW